MSENSKELLTGCIALAGIIVVCGLVFFFIEYIASKIDPIPVNRLEVPFKMAKCAGIVWFIEFCIFIAALEIDKKYKCFGFSSDSGMGGLYFILVGPIVCILIWFSSRFFNGLPTNGRDVFTLGTKLGFFSSVLPFFIIIVVMLASNILNRNVT